ncbi:MAG: ADP-ribosylglycohydrolase family protein [Clostridiales bacterium]|uniref:ADP-ribosylglycohydrolase family protein n=1 Tax=Hornefia butyriciproducens TaxID=2652293 RepID=UPI002A90988D|nr:ADP-ribosylglycohydrolase family protein [Hornefia butyriciproducens]MCI7679803.1 ADP-ribosylglycohydrolase family protein [Clostridiales bacterium]MDY5462609.1 ADP-ribosylglycohydrolase family protein [Hornefia butyriciproducens]
MAMQFNNMTAYDVKSAIFGVVTADALGVPVEFSVREDRRRDPVTGMREYGTYNQPKGTWSDDSSMTLAALDSLSAGVDYGDIMKRFAAWAQKGDYTPHRETFDMGEATRRAIIRYLDGTPPLECGGTGERDNGNGSLMRIMPFVLVAIRDGDRKIRDLTGIHNASALTHRHPRCMVACGIYARLTAALIDAMTGNKMNLAAAAVSGALKDYSRSPFAEETDTYRRMADLKALADLPESEIRSSGYVVDTLEAAVWCFLNTESYRDCVLKAVNLGEDTDTVAAVAGGLAGVWYGFDAIPSDWVDVLARREWIEELCRNLL